MKQLLAAQEVMFPRLFHSIQAAINPIMAINKTGINLRSLLGQTTATGNSTTEEEEDF